MDFPIVIILPTIQIVKMFGAVTLIFAVCWLPYHVYFIYSYFHPEIMKVMYSEITASLSAVLRG